jgi:hypothetical protein
VNSEGEQKKKGPGRPPKKNNVSEGFDEPSKNVASEKGSGVGTDHRRRTLPLEGPTRQVKTLPLQY